MSFCIYKVLQAQHFAHVNCVLWKFHMPDFTCEIGTGEVVYICCRYETSTCEKDKNVKFAHMWNCKTFTFITCDHMW